MKTIITGDKYDIPIRIVLEEPIVNTASLDSEKEYYYICIDKEDLDWALNHQPNLILISKGECD